MSAQTTAPMSHLPPPSLAGRDVADCGRWLEQAWLADRRRATLPGGVPRVQFPAANLARTGSGVRVALLDAPVDRSHPDLRDAHLWGRFRGATWTGKDPSDDVRRATALASVLVGQGAREVRGLVPDAELLVAPVRSRDDRTADDLIVRAVRWALIEGAQILVLPFGRRRLGRRVAMVLRSAAEAGTRVFVAAGDLGPDVLAFPASVSGVVAVTAYDRGAVLPQCSRQADLAAPGRDVPAAGGTLQGSAAATVLAAGAWAGTLGAVLELAGTAPDRGWAPAR